MQLDHRHARGKHCIAQRYAGMCEGAGIEDQQSDLVRSCLMDTLDELVLRVALKAEELPAFFAGELCGPALEGLERLRPVEPGLPGSEQIEVGSVQQQQTGHAQKGRRARIKRRAGIYPNSKKMGGFCGECRETSEPRVCSRSRPSDRQLGHSIRDLAARRPEVDPAPVEVVHAIED